jgi:hypothetical protein
MIDKARQIAVGRKYATTAKITTFVLSDLFSRRFAQFPVLSPPNSAESAEFGA